LLFFGRQQYLPALTNCCFCRASLSLRIYLATSALCTKWAVTSKNFAFPLVSPSLGRDVIGDKVEHFHYSISDTELVLSKGKIMPLFCWSMPWQLSSRVKLVFSLPRFKGSLGKGRPSKVMPRLFVATWEFKGCIGGTVVSRSKVGRMGKAERKNKLLKCGWF